MKVLLIEDDKFFQKFYSVKLKEKKVEVEVASDGEEGLLKMRNTKPDLILLDLIMPKVDGFSVLAKRQEDQELKKIPVIVFSTLGMEKDIETAQKLGANGYMNKGFFDFDNMIAKINQVMSSR